MTARVDTTVDLDVGADGSDNWTSAAAARPATISELPLDDGPGARIRFGVNLGAFGDIGEVIVPLAALEQFVDQTRAREAV